MSLALTPRRAALAPGPWVRNELWRRARAVPSLDLRFADNKSLVDATTGSSLVTFTRASSGTFVGSDGVIRTAVTNLLLRSEEFGTTWTTTRASITADAAVAPNGTTTADKLVEDTTANNSHFVQQGTVSTGVTYAVSVYAKAGERDRFSISSMGLGAQGFAPTFNLATGSLTGAPAGSSITPVGNGWYRCVVIAVPSTTSGPLFELRNEAGSNSYTGDGTSGIYLWGAQLEQSSTVGEYIPTTSAINSAPRFDHNPTTGESLGLLVVQARSNVVYPSQFTSFGTVAASNIWYEAAAELDCTANAGVAPDGTQTAALLATNTNTTLKSVTNRTGANTQATYSYSVFCKAASTDDSVRLNVAGEAALTNGVRAVFTLSGNGVASAATAIGTATAPSAPTIQPMGNGWYRCTVVAALTSPTNITCQVFPGNAAAQTAASQTLVWGAQLEAGDFPTSYIPTTAATVTRSADVCSISGSNFSAWYRQDEGTLYGDAFRPFAVPGPDFPIIADTRTGTDRFQIGYLTEGLASAYVQVGGAGQAELYPGSGNARNRKVAFAAAANSYAAVCNGGTVATDVSGLMPASMTSLSIGSMGSAQFLNGTIRRLVFWGQRLPNNILQSITQ